MWRGKVDAGNSWDASMVVSTRLIMTSFRDRGIFRPREAYVRLRKKNYTQQECIPVGCALLYRLASVQGVSVQGISVQGVSVQWVSFQGGLCPGRSLSRGSLSGRPPLPTDRLPQTSFACGKNLYCFEMHYLYEEQLPPDRNISTLHRPHMLGNIINNMVSHLDNELCCFKHCWGVYVQNSIVDWCRWRWLDNWKGDHC